MISGQRLNFYSGDYLPTDIVRVLQSRFAETLYTLPSQNNNKNKELGKEAYGTPGLKE